MVWLAHLVQQEPNAESLPNAVLGGVAPLIVLAKPGSRQMLGFMNEMTRFAEYAIADAGLALRDIAILNREQRRMLHNRNRPLRDTARPGAGTPAALLTSNIPNYD